MAETMSNLSEMITDNLVSKNSVLRGIETDHSNSEERIQLENELRLTLEEIARLQNALVMAEMKLITYQNELSQAFPPEKEDINALMILVHEMDQPLITIMNYCDLLQNRNVGEITAIQRKFIERISSSAKQIRNLTNQFKKSNQKNEVTSPPVVDGQINISNLLNRMIESKSKLLEQKQITLQLSVSERIPEFIGNEKNIETIIDFVLSNALTITPSDSMVKIIANTLNIYKERVVQIIVKDGGPGIALKDLDKLLIENEPPEQIHPGLSIPHSHLLILNRLITEQKGTLNIRNGLDYGAIFEINLPLKQS